MTKLEAIEKMCREASKNVFRKSENMEAGEKAEREQYKSSLTEEGRFSDLADDPDGAVEAMQRLVYCSEEYHWLSGREWPEGLKEKVLAGAAHYCKIEADREDRGTSRFHDSIFRFPTLALNIYFILYPDMEKTEKNPEKYPETAAAREQLLRVAYQTFALPERGDETDQNPVCVERFRHHVWWMGGNAFCYRPVFNTALAMKSVEMMDVLAEAAARSISAVSQSVSEEAFWSEGMCADGFGWGHGRQTYNTGYPADGLNSALTILSYIVGTPFEEYIKYADFTCVINFIRGITWGGYGDEAAPMQSRNIFLKDKSRKATADEVAVSLAQFLKNCFWKYLTEEQQAEMDMLLAKRHSLEMEGPDGVYRGVRYFWNNDDLIKKEKGFYFYINMASKRCDGVEFADVMADKRNYYTADGSYTLLTNGDELRDVMGTWQTAHLPGVTERYLPNSELMTETNWHGYRSKHNVAAGVALKDNGVCGFLYEKDDTREPDGAGVVYDKFTRQMCGVQAYKSYFIIGDTICCLGAGITDLKPEYGREIHTTVNNTRLSGAGELTEKDGYITVENENILYMVKARDNMSVKLAKENRRTHWSDLHLGNSSADDEELPVFELILNHGERPVNAGYEYHMCVNHTDTSRVKVLENSTRLQAVAQRELHVVEAVFYDREAVLKVQEIEVRVSEPCALLLVREKEGYRIAVCDTEQNPKLKQITVTFVRDGSLEDVVIQMPEGLYRGKQGEGYYCLPLSICR